jgi:hypothetical protein
MIDFNRDDYVNVLAGLRPDNWVRTIERAQRLLHAAEAAGVEVDEDVFLLAALAAYHKTHANSLAFVQRAKQIVRWAEPPEQGEREPTSLAVLENKARELARLVAKGLFANESFVLLLANQGEGGHLTWIGSIDRRTQIKLFEEHVAQLKAVQEHQS